MDQLRAIGHSKGLTRLEAMDVFDKMKKEARLQLDVWGATLNYKVC